MFLDATLQCVCRDDGPGPHAPSTRVWLGNIAGHVREPALQSVFNCFGQGLSDGAVFPARIGPLGYAFVNFVRLEDANLAYQQLNNTAVPTLSGNKLLKMRFKPASVSPIVPSSSYLQTPFPYVRCLNLYRNL